MMKIVGMEHLLTWFFLLLILSWIPEHYAIGSSSESTKPQVSDTNHLIQTLCRAMAELGKDPDSRSTGTSSLCLTKAARVGLRSLVVILLDSGVNVDQRDGNDKTALHEAAGEGHVEIARLLVDAGADVNARNTWKETPLHWASYRDREAVINVLQRGNIIVDAKNEMNETPLRMAITFKRTRAIKKLVELGASLAKTNTSDYLQSEFDSSMQDERVQNAIKEGKRLRNLLIAANGEFPDVSQWMGHVKDDVSLTKLSIPGTHDTCARFAGLDITEQAVCHDLTLAEQLQHGVRFIDIRTRRSGGYDLAIHHGQVYQRKSLGSVLDDVKKFLESHPTETVLFAYQEEYHAADGAKSYRDCLQHYLSKEKWASFIWQKYDQIPTLGEVRGKMFFIDHKDTGIFGLGKSKMSIEDDWEAVILRRSMWDYSKLCPSLGVRPTKMNHIKENMERAESENTLLYFTFCSGTDDLLVCNPRAIAHKINPKVKDFLDSQVTVGSTVGDAGPKVGTVLFDFPTSTLITSIINRNFRSDYRDMLQLGVMENALVLAQTPNFTRNFFDPNVIEQKPNQKRYCIQEKKQKSCPISIIHNVAMFVPIHIAAKILVRDPHVGPRPKKFFPEKSTDKDMPGHSDFNNCNSVDIDRGHMLANSIGAHIDLSNHYLGQLASFTMLNVVPQYKANNENQGAYTLLETGIKNFIKNLTFCPHNPSSLKPFYFAATTRAMKLGNKFTCIKKKCEINAALPFPKTNPVDHHVYTIPEFMGMAIACPKTATNYNCLFISMLNKDDKINNYKKGEIFIGNQKQSAFKMIFGYEAFGGMACDSYPISDSKYLFNDPIKGKITNFTMVPEDNWSGNDVISE